MKRAAHVAWQQVEGEAVLVDLEGNRLLGLNPTGALLWSLLDGRSESELASAIAARFDVPTDAARTDIAAFLAELRRRGLVEEDP